MAFVHRRSPRDTKIIETIYMNALPTLAQLTVRVPSGGHACEEL